MKKLLTIAICLAVIAFAVNIYAGQQIKNYSHYPFVSAIYLPYPENIATGYKQMTTTSLSLETILERLKVGTPEDEVFELLGLPISASASNWYELNLNWDKNFSWERWVSGELWNITEPHYQFRVSDGSWVSLIIVYDEQRNIKELIYW